MKPVTYYTEGVVGNKFREGNLEAVGNKFRGGKLEIEAVLHKFRGKAVGHTFLILLRFGGFCGN
jgi:hypothetical protein